MEYNDLTKIFFKMLTSKDDPRSIEEYWEDRYSEDIDIEWETDGGK